jgi:tRNA/rRNA methyltransferase
MVNFGLRDLVVVAPFDPVWQESRSAVGAEDLVKSARAVDELEEAIGDATLVVGTTTGSRRNLDRDLILLDQLAGWLRGRKERGRAALVFGSEKTGLSNQHFSYCHALVRIPTSPLQPSMNLSQAVAVCCYELARAGAVSARSPTLKVHPSGPATAGSLARVFDRAARVLDRAGYFKPRSRDAELVKLRRFLFDLGLTSHEVRVLGGMLAQTEWKLDHPT